MTCSQRVWYSRLSTRSPSGTNFDVGDGLQPFVFKAKLDEFRGRAGRFAPAATAAARDGDVRTVVVEILVIAEKIVDDEPLLADARRRARAASANLLVKNRAENFPAHDNVQHLGQSKPVVSMSTLTATIG
jgi:hypothetical protein